jgi:uncharacterized membrane protein YfcA
MSKSVDVEGHLGPQCTPMEWIVVLAVGLAAGTVGGIVGFGTSIMLLPPLVIFFGPHEAVPMMAVTALMANLSRVAVWWKEVDWKACGAYSATAIPFSALGATTLVHMNDKSIELALGFVFILMIPARRWLQARGIRVKLWQLAVVGAVIGFLTGIVVSTGPINTPFFLAHGLVKGAFLSTEAAASLSMYVTKSIVFNQFGYLPWDVLSKGLIVGTSVMAGAWVAKRFVLRMDAAYFKLLMDGLMLAAGVTMISTALAPAA